MAYRSALWLLFLLLTAANIYIYVNRNNGYEYVKQSSYADLYPNISKGIRSISIEKNNDVVIDLKGYNAAKWSVRCNDAVITNELSLPLRFALKEKINRYLLIPIDSSNAPVTIDLDYSPAALYKANSSSIATNYEIRYCSVPFISNDSFSVNKWRDELEYIEATEQSIVKKIITDSLHLKENDSTAVKIKIIGSYIFNAIKNNMGVPADSLKNYSVYQQFSLAKEGRANIWCGNITDIFHLFATNAGMVCRKIGISGNKDAFRLGDHSLNECYIPETGEWAYIDITQNILLLKDSKGRYLNTADLYQLKKQQQTGNILQLSVGDSSVIETNYTEADKKYIWQQNEILYPHPYNPKTLYSFSNKFQRYAGVHPWLEVYNENRRYDNHRFYLKSFLLHSWILLGLIILVLYPFTKKHRP
ncbi:MAG: hypothetical protein HYX40_04455 [Sphingobacteriales bacterium]|nr:hypothetical protein [Sphingobacteriales bacterium]